MPSRSSPASSAISIAEDAVRRVRDGARALAARRRPPLSGRLDRRHGSERAIDRIRRERTFVREAEMLAGSTTSRTTRTPT